MTPSLITPQNVTFVLGILGVIFTIYNYFKNPQTQEEKKAALLAQQVQWTIEGSERRFKDMQESFNGLLLQSNNHIHTVDTKVDVLTGKINDMAVIIEKLSTIIDERIPKKG